MYVSRYRGPHSARKVLFPNNFYQPRYFISAMKPKSM